MLRIQNAPIAGFLGPGRIKFVCACMSAQTLILNVGPTSSLKVNSFLTVTNVEVFSTSLYNFPLRTFLFLLTVYSKFITLVDFLSAVSTCIFVEFLLLIFVSVLLTQMENPILASIMALIYVRHLWQTIIILFIEHYFM